MKFIAFNSLLILLILFIIGCESTGRGGGGGGRGGGSRGGSKEGSRGGRGGSRGGSSGSSPYNSSTFRQALIGGCIYGSDSYMRSSRYRSHPNDMPTICTNEYDKDSNGTTYGYFICPRDEEPRDYNDCCGDEKRERCCKYYPFRIIRSPSFHGPNSLAIIIGSISVCSVVLYALYFYCQHKMSNKTYPDPVKTNDSTDSTVPVKTNDSTDAADNKPPVTENTDSVKPLVPIGFDNLDTSYPSQPPPPYSETTLPPYSETTLPPYSETTEKY